MPESMVARPVPYEPTVTGLATVPLSVELKDSEPLNISPPSNNMLSPGEKVVLLTLLIVCQASPGEVPELASLPEGLT